VALICYLVARHWLTPRVDEIHCKGKGLMKTFWCNPKSGTGSAVSSQTVPETEEQQETQSTDSPDVNQNRLVVWSVDLFAGMLKEIVAHRVASSSNELAKNHALEEPTGASMGNPLDEVADVLDLPKPSNTKTKFAPPELEATIGDAAMTQLNDLVGAIAGLYRDNPFHSFDHASHVTMATKKLLDRVVGCEKDKQNRKSQVIDGSCAILTDPLTQFAIVFAALIHDVDHQGVSNAQLIQEEHPTAIMYAGKSVAEQNSVDIAWRLLMQPEFADLRNCICVTEREHLQFRQVLINVVLATDLFDRDLKAMRESRWALSFGDKLQDHGKGLVGVDANRRATIIIELIIQASDVSHTMQHFTVYQKWNHCLLTELYDAYACGRTDKDPTLGWYEGELWFFDNYIIPLAQKLRECGVFGVSCDEFLDYAMDNRLEWETKGREIVRSSTEALKLRHLEEPVMQWSRKG
jgi:3'5'-cyclic nucleotide phosphodiesterase